MPQINYELVVTTSGNESQDNAALEAETVKAALENAIIDLKFSSGQAQIEVTSLEEN